MVSFTLKIGFLPGAAARLYGASRVSNRRTQNQPRSTQWPEAMSTSNSSDARAHPTPLADSAHDFVLDRIRENRFDVELTLEVGIYITRMGDVEKGSRWVDKGKFVQSKTRHRILRRDRIADIAFHPGAELNKHTDHADNTVRVFVGSACQGDNGK